MEVNRIIVTGHFLCMDQNPVDSMLIKITENLAIPATSIGLSPVFRVLKWTFWCVTRQDMSS